jgi:hypothetical protein
MKYYVKSSLSDNIHSTPEGFLLCIGVPIARTGEMVYGEGEIPLDSDEDGKVLVNREEKEVFSPKTMASFEGKAITITHPTEFVDPNNWARLAKGIMQNIRRGTDKNKDDLLADLLITDSVAINLVKNGLREVSCGYEADYTQVEDGKGIQTNIIGNHLALVDEGRAGPRYAINDHKGASTMSGKVIEILKKKFGVKVIDEAMAEADKDDKKDTKDVSGYSMDDVTKMFDALNAKMDAMMKGGAKDAKDASTQPVVATGEPAKVEAKDEDPMTALSDRLKALEASVAKLLENKATGDESDLITDEDGEDDEETEDDDFEESTATGDTASRIEILAPGLKNKTKDAKAAALKVAYATADGKKVIESLTGGKAPTYDSAEKVDTLFICASELLKVQRSSEFSKTKTRDSNFDDGASNDGEPMSAEKLNEINAKHYAKK